MVFPVVMYGCESWTVKKAERQRIDAFEPWCWRRLLRVPWTARRSNQSILRRSALGFPWNGQRPLADSGNGGTNLDFLSPFLWIAPPLEMRRERREFFPEHAGKDPSSPARRWKQGSSRCERDSRASSPLETSMSGSFLSCSKDVKDPLEVPRVRCD